MTTLGVFGSMLGDIKKMSRDVGTTKKVKAHLVRSKIIFPSVEKDTKGCHVTC
jgi:hypothetical protein